MAKPGIGRPSFTGGMVAVAARACSCAVAVAARFPARQAAAISAAALWRSLLGRVLIFLVLDLDFDVTVRRSPAGPCDALVGSVGVVSN
jgi:hypothetical protein